MFNSKKFTILLIGSMLTAICFGACNKKEQAPVEQQEQTITATEPTASNVVAVKTHMDENVTVRVTLPDYKNFKLTKVTDEGFRLYLADVLEGYYKYLPETDGETHEIDEAFATAMGYTSVDEYLVAAREELNQMRYKQFLADFISSNSNIDQLPAEELAIRTAQYADEQYAYAKYLAQSTGTEIEVVMKKLTGYSEYSELVGATNREMREMLNYQYTLEAIFQKEKLTYSDELLKEAEESYVGGEYESIAEVEADKDLMVMLISNLKTSAAEEYLIENALK